MVYDGLVSPDYRIHEYFSGFYKLVKFKNADRVAAALRDHSKDSHYDTKLDPSYCRARSVVLQLGLCNEWDWFFTGTLDPRKFNRYDLHGFASRFTQWIRDERKRSPEITLSYVLVPERHEDGAWHIHGLISGLPESELAKFVPGVHPRRLVEGGYLNWPAFSRKFGFCSLGRVKDRIRCAFYVTKYVSKDLASRGNSSVRSHLYFSSQGLKRASHFGDVYGSYSVLDSYLTDNFEFCSTGYVECSWSNWLDFIDLGPEMRECVESVSVPAAPCEEWEQMKLSLVSSERQV